MTLSTTTRLLGRIAARSDRRHLGLHPTHGQQRATENQTWRREANADLAALKLVTTR